MFWHHAIATIPTPHDIRLVPGYLRWSNAQWALDLTSGRVIKTYRPDVKFDDEGKLIGIDYLKDTEQLAVSVDVPGTSQPTERAIVELWGLPTILSARYLIVEDRDQLRAVDLESADKRVVTATISPANVEIHGGAMTELRPIPGTNRFLRNNYGATTPDVTLYQIESDQIRMLNTWPGMAEFSLCRDRIYISRSDQRLIEVRSATDGSLIETIPYPDVSGEFRPTWYSSTRQDWQIFQGNHLTKFVCFDLSQKRIIDLPSSDYCPLLNDKSSYVVLHSSLNEKAGELLIYDRQKEAVIQRVNSPLIGGDFTIYDQKHLVFSNRAHGISAALIDMTSGREVQRWTPFAWTSWSSLLFCPLMLLWVISWCKTSARAHDWAWVDLAVVGGLLVVMAAYRVGESRFILVATLLACSILLLSMIQFTTWWVVVKKTHVITAVSTFFLTLGVAQTAYVECVAQHDNSQRWGLFWACGFTLPLIALCGSVLRWIGWSVRREQEPRVALSIYHYMILIAAMAAFCNSIRATMALEGGHFGGWEFVICLAIPAVLGMLGLIVGLSSSRRLFIAASGLACVALLCIVGYRLVQLFAGDLPIYILERMWFPNQTQYDSIGEALAGELPHLAEAMLVGTFAPFLATIPFRLRGWSLSRTAADLSGQC